MPELHLANRVKELTTTEGTGAVSLGGALDGHQSFADSPITDGQTVAYLIRHRTIASEWEVGYGTFDATAGTLSRDTVLESPTDAKINFSSGDKIVFVGVAAEEVLLEGTAESISSIWDFAGGLNVGGVQLADASGEIPDARLSANVALLNAAQTFSAVQTIAADLIVDTDTLFVDASTDRVGIGTGSPAEALHVAVGKVVIGTDPGGTTNILRVGGGAEIGGVNFRDDGVCFPLADGGARLGGDSNRYSRVHAQAYQNDGTNPIDVPEGAILGPDPGGSELLRVGGGARLVDWAFTNFPTRDDLGLQNKASASHAMLNIAPLDLDGTDQVGFRLVSVDSGGLGSFTDAEYLQVRSISGVHEIQSLVTGTGTLYPIKMGVNSLTQLVLATDGNVGIGTSSPGATLDVDGDIGLIDGMTAPGATPGTAKLFVDSADGDLKVIFGDGTVKTLATDA